MEPIIDEAGMCIVNTASIARRISNMGERELKYVSDISNRFLTHLIHLAHCPDANKIKEAAFDMMKLLLNEVFNNDSLNNELPSYRSADLPTPPPPSILGCLDPVAILTGILDDGGSGAATLSKGMEGILSVLDGYNPLKLDDVIVIEKCNGGRGCTACSYLHSAAAAPSSSSSHNEALLCLLRCLNHRRLNFGGDIVSARASAAFVRNENNPRVIVVPLRRLLLSCVDASALSRNGADGGDKGSLFERVKRLSLHDRASLSQIYAFLIFSRHRQQSGDCIKQFLYTIFARFLYSATEILFCADEHASREVDGGRFLEYAKAWTNVSVLSSTLNTMKACQLWRNEGSSVAPVLNLFSTQWKRHYSNSEALVRLGADMAKFIATMAAPTRLGSGGGGGRNANTGGLDSIRSVRQAEKYIPFGFVEQHRGSLKILPTGVSVHARSYSNGNNIPCNCFHVLPRIKGGEILGPATAVDQAAFEKTICPGGVENGTGKMTGLITAYIDKTVLGSTLPADPSDFENRINNFVKDIIFRKTTVHEESVNDYTALPDSRMWANPVMPATCAQTIAKCFDTRMYTLFLLWQKPCVECPNVSALTASQLELTLSRDPKWAEFIARIFFLTERVSFQLADAIVKNVSGGGGVDGVLKAIFSSNLSDASAAQNLIDASLNAIFRDWSAAAAAGDVVAGARAQYTSKLYELLHKIVIENDMDPACVVAYSKFLCDYVKFTDELLTSFL